ncbi:hypothetical protein ACWEQC_06660 [Streptomyces shenzhenensis]
MPRITLAHWHDGQAPGTELTVDDAELAALRHDGRIADVLDGPAAHPAPSPDVPQDEPAEPEPAPAEAPAGRKRR